ncbi:uncharacterized protein LOC131285292 [Anopheles ziemanni]|uniref:uncharacterized protein LOC131271547 n=1 Tax=Anopheles coustani TaxID=139045 RepID=UPI002659D703|nr:uncharacterized protein LOC131271547 [Anopheles coustani]XP_058170130.1 uncharacterized protein LOC131285292 [Anopheles ziemanni]
MALQLKSISAILLVTLCILSVVNVSRQASLSVQLLSRGERSTSNQTLNERMCESNTPCGWALYVPFSRQIEKFMKNTCECEKTLECMRTDDDVSISAYVYRCRENKPTPES